MESPNDKTRPFFSVIITTSDRTEFMAQAINSVLQQTSPPDTYEIIVVKNFTDASTDSLIEKNNIFHLDDIGGFNGRRLYEGIRNSSGEVICFLDDDDIFVQDKLERLRELFSRNRDLGYYHNSQTLIDEEGKDIPGFREPPPSSSFYINTPVGKELKNAIKARTDISIYSLMFNLSSIAIRREMIQKYLDIFPELEFGTDWFIFYLSLASGLRMFIDDRMLTKYRIHRSTSNVFQKVKSFRHLSDDVISRFLRDGYWVNLLYTKLKGTPAFEYIDCKRLEQKFVIRSAGLKEKVEFSMHDLFRYQKCLLSTTRVSARALLKILFALSATFLPVLTGYFYNLFTYHLYARNLRKSFSHAH